MLRLRGWGNAYGDWSGDPTLALRCDATVVLTAQDFGAPVSETVCGDGGDGDLDGRPDCTDPDCADAAVCQATCVFDGRPDEASWTARGTTAGHPSVIEPSCAPGPTGAEALVHFTAPSDGQWRFSTRDSRFRTLLSAFDRCGGKELACSDPVWVGDSLCVWEADYSTFTLPLVAGQEVVLVVDGRTVDQRGEWVLTAELL